MDIFHLSLDEINLIDLMNFCHNMAALNHFFKGTFESSFTNFGYVIHKEFVVLMDIK